MRYLFRDKPGVHFGIRNSVMTFSRESDTARAHGRRSLRIVALATRDARSGELDHDREGPEGASAHHTAVGTSNLSPIFT